MKRGRNATLSINRIPTGRAPDRLSDRQPQKSTMYIGPDTILPFASAIAAVMGFVLMFWRRFVGLMRSAFSSVRRRISSTDSK